MTLRERESILSIAGKSAITNGKQTDLEISPTLFTSEISFSKPRERE
jgi:hypothetical protein